MLQVVILGDAGQSKASCIYFHRLKADRCLNQRVNRLPNFNPNARWRGIRRTHRAKRLDDFRRRQSKGLVVYTLLFQVLYKILSTEDFNNAQRALTSRGDDQPPLAVTLIDRWSAFNGLLFDMSLTDIVVSTYAQLTCQIIPEFRAYAVGSYRTEQTLLCPIHLFHRPVYDFCLQPNTKKWVRCYYALILIDARTTIVCFM